MPIVAVRTPEQAAAAHRAASLAAQTVRTDLEYTPRIRVRPAPPPVRIRSTPKPAPAPLDNNRHLTPADPGYVGYKNPPKRTQFQKGQSGNPKGRPKGAKGLKTLARERLTEKVVVKSAAGPKRMTRLDAMMLKMIELAFAGNMRAMQFCMQLYDSAVPDETPRMPVETQVVADMDAHDEAILAALHETLLARGAAE